MEAGYLKYKQTLLISLFVIIITVKQVGRQKSKVLLYYNVLRVYLVLPYDRNCGMHLYWYYIAPFRFR